MPNGVDIAEILPQNMKKLLRHSKVLQTSQLLMQTRKELMFKSVDSQLSNFSIKEKWQTTMVQELQMESSILCWKNIETYINHNEGCQLKTWRRFQWSQPSKRPWVRLRIWWERCYCFNWQYLRVQRLRWWVCLVCIVLCTLVRSLQNISSLMGWASYELKRRSKGRQGRRNRKQRGSRTFRSQRISYNQIFPRRQERRWLSYRLRRSTNGTSYGRLG